MEKVKKQILTLANSEKFESLLEWYEAGHEPDSGYEWQEETFEEAFRIFGGVYQQTGGNVYVGMLKLAENIWAVFSADLIRIVRVLKESEDVFEMLEDGNTVDIFVKYAN